MDNQIELVWAARRKSNSIATLELKYIYPTKFKLDAFDYSIHFNFLFSKSLAAKITYLKWRDVGNYSSNPRHNISNISATFYYPKYIYIDTIYNL